MTLNDAHPIGDHAVDRSPPLAARLWSYQQQRFPLQSHGLLIVLFAVACLCFGAASRAVPSSPSLPAAIVVILCVLIAFFQLRVADEHRDAQEDAYARPHLPVPSGLVSLGELRLAAVIGAAVQVAATATFHPPLVALLFPLWGFIGLVAIDFGAKTTLERRPALSLALHLGFMPLVALFAVATDQLPETGAFSPGLAAFLILSATAAATLELARKCLAAEDERGEITSYSLVWGAASAGLVTAAAIVCTLVLGFLAYLGTRTAGAFFIPVIIIGAAAFLAAIVYAQSPERRWSATLRGATNVFVAAIYTGVGLVPFLMHLAGR